MTLFNNEHLEQIGQQLLENNETLAVAESVTAGLLQHAFSNIPQASQLFQGGVTAYNIAQKFKHLNIEPIHALSVNCVSQKVAAEMALHVCERFNSHWGLAVTGYATPTDASGNKIFAYYAIAYQQVIRAQGLISPSLSLPPEVQLEYVNTVIAQLHSLLASGQ